MVTNGIFRWEGWDAISCAPLWLFWHKCAPHEKPTPPSLAFEGDAGGSRLVLSGLQARYAGGLVSLYYRPVTEPHFAACDKKKLGFHHHLNPVGSGGWFSVSVGVNAVNNVHVGERNKAQRRCNVAATAAQRSGATDATRQAASLLVTSASSALLF